MKKTSHLARFIDDYKIENTYWIDLIEILGDFSDKLKLGKSFVAQEIQIKLIAIIDLPLDSIGSYHCLKRFLQAAYRDNIKPDVAVYLREREIPDLILYTKKNNHE